MTKLVRDPEQRLDSLLGHCMMRAVIAAEGGLDGAREKYGPDASVSKWTGLKVVAKVTPKASRVAGFVALWAVAMKMENRDEFTITEYERYWNEGERQTFRLQKEFRELWPEFETPNELARHIVEQIDARASKKDVATLPMRLMVMA